MIIRLNSSKFQCSFKDLSFYASDTWNRKVRKCTNRAGRVYSVAVNYINFISCVQYTIIDMCEVNTVLQVFEKYNCHAVFIRRQKTNNQSYEFGNCGPILLISLYLSQRYVEVNEIYDTSSLCNEVIHPSDIGLPA